MSRFCTNCGHQNESPNARYCEACGQPLEQSEQNNDFEFDFASQSQSHQTYTDDNYAPSTEEIFGTAPVTPVSNVSFENTKKINKAKKDLNGWTIAVLVLAIIRTCVMFSTIDELDYISSMLPQMMDEYASMFSSYLATAYVEIVVLVGLLVASIVLTIFSSKIIKIKDPANNMEMFDHAKKAHVSAVVAMVFCIIYLICEIAVVAISNEIERATGEDILDIGTIIGAIGGEVLLIAGTAICAMNARKIVKAKNVY